MIHKGFKQNIKNISYYKAENEEYDTDTIIIVYEFKVCSAHVVSSKFGVELYEVIDDKVQHEPTLVRPAEKELIAKLKEMKGRKQ